MTQTIEQLTAKVAELEADIEFQTNARIQDRKDAETNYKNWNAELKKQLAAAQEDNQKLRIALDSTKRDLIRMRCPDFFEGVRDGYEFSFDNNLVNMIGLINDYTKQE
jgi:chromosome segregation ATPase